MDPALSLGVDLNRLRLDQLQEAVRSNRVSFPSQVPVFIKHSGGQQQSQVILLYFVLGWNCDRIAKRYKVTRQHIWQIVSEWKGHAVALGYLQVIPPAEVLLPLRSGPAFRPMVGLIETAPPPLRLSGS